MPACPSCKNQNPAGAAACDYCGFALLPPTDGRKTRMEPAPSGPPAPGSRVTRLEPTAPTPARNSGGSPFDRAPTRPVQAAGHPPSGAFDRAPRASNPPPPPHRSTLLAAAPSATAGEPIAGVLVAYRTPADPGVLHRLRYGRNTIGRHATSDVLLDDETVSENHAFLFIDANAEGGRFLDVSTNGSLVDGQKVNGAQANLRSGSTLLVGATVLVFTAISPPAPTIWGLR